MKINLTVEKADAAPLRKIADEKGLKWLAFFQKFVSTALKEYNYILKKMEV